MLNQSFNKQDMYMFGDGNSEAEPEELPDFRCCVSPMNNMTGTPLVQVFWSPTKNTVEYRVISEDDKTS